MSTYAISDLHGRLDLWQAAQAYLQPNDTIYFLGDAADRGPDGWALIKALLADPRVHYLKGNHENLLIKAQRGWSSLALWYTNGGYITDQASDMDDEAKKLEVIAKIKELPFKEIYINPKGQKFYLCHSGIIHPGLWQYVDEEDCTWDREHFLKSVKEEFKENEFTVHGHTYTFIIAEETGVDYTDGALFYDGGHKICIDCCSPYTGKTVLLNLDTFETVNIAVPLKDATA